PPVIDLDQVQHNIVEQTGEDRLLLFALLHRVSCALKHVRRRRETIFEEVDQRRLLRHRFKFRELCPAAARATASENRPSAAPYSELGAGGLLVERLHHMVFEGVSERFGWHRLNHGRGPQRGKERSTINFHVTSSIPGLRVAWLPRARCPRQARGARYAT